MGYFYLSIAIVTEVIATLAVKSSQEFTKLWPSVVVVIGYVLSYYFMALTFKTISIGVTYAIWCGVGIVAITIAGYLMHNESLNAGVLAGIGLISLGVVVVSLFAESSS